MVFVPAFIMGVVARHCGLASAEVALLIFTGQGQINPLVISRTVTWLNIRECFRKRTSVSESRICAWNGYYRLSRIGNEYKFWAQGVQTDRRNSRFLLMCVFAGTRKEA